MAEERFHATSEKEMVWLWTNQADHSHTSSKRDNQLGLDDAYRHLFCNSHGKRENARPNSDVTTANASEHSMV